MLRFKREAPTTTVGASSRRSDQTSPVKKIVRMCGNAERRRPNPATPRQEPAGTPKVEVTHQWDAHTLGETDPTPAPSNAAAAERSGRRTTDLTRRWRVAVHTIRPARTRRVVRHAHGRTPATHQPLAAGGVVMPFVVPSSADPGRPDTCRIRGAHAKHRRPQGAGGEAGVRNAPERPRERERPHPKVGPYLYAPVTPPTAPPPPGRPPNTPTGSRPPPATGR